MREAIRRLEGAFRLTELKLDAKGLVSGRREVGKFLLAGTAKGPGAETGRVWFGSRLPEVSDRELGELQLAVQRVLDALVNGVSLDYPEMPKLTVVLAPVAAGKAVTITVVDGGVTDRYLLALMLLVAHVGGERVQRCPACGGAFLKQGRRASCNRPECRRLRANKYWHAYTKTAAGRRWRRRHYERLYATLYKDNGWTPLAKSKRKRVNSRNAMKRSAAR
jgi:hypothetical protein